MRRACNAQPVLPGSLQYRANVRIYWPASNFIQTCSVQILLRYSNKMIICYTAVCEFQHYCLEFNVQVLISV